MEDSKPINLDWNLLDTYSSGVRLEARDGTVLEITKFSVSLPAVPKGFKRLVIGRGWVIDELVDKKEFDKEKSLSWLNETFGSYFPSPCADVSILTKNEQRWMTIKSYEKDHQEPPLYKYQARIVVGPDWVVDETIGPVAIVDSERCRSDYSI